MKRAGLMRGQGRANEKGAGLMKRAGLMRGQG